MKLKTYYRKIAKLLDHAMFNAELACDMVGIKDPALLKWGDDGEKLFEKYKELRDATPTEDQAMS